MKIPCSQWLRGIAAALALALLSLDASAQSYPTRPIKVINPWPAGGAADLIARPIFVKLSDALGQPIVTENKPGANGTLGAAIAAKSPADGYTLFLSHVGPVAISPAMQTLPYDPVKDLQPVTQLVSGPLVVVVRPDLPIKSIAELIAYAKANPGKLSYGSVGQGSTTHLAGEMMSQLTGVSLLHVPYKGNGPVITDMLGGQIEFSFLNIAGALPFINSGKLRAIAVTTLKRSAVLPDLPTVAETLPGFEVNSWYGVMVPAGTPKPIVDRLYTEIARILKSPEIVDQMKQAGLDIEGTTPEQHAAKIKDDISRWAKLVKATGVVAN